MLTYLPRSGMSFEQFVAFFVFAVVTSITPGPNNLMLTATGANVGIRGGLPHMFGIALGFSLMLFLVAAGIGGALLESPAAMRVLRIIGIVVMLWLAWKIATAGRSEAAARKRPIGFFEAAAFQWVNPKAWLICASAVGSFLDAEGDAALRQATLFALIFIVACLPCTIVWLGFGAAMQRILRTDRARSVSSGPTVHSASSTWRWACCSPPRCSFSCRVRRNPEPRPGMRADREGIQSIRAATLRSVGRAADSSLGSCTR